MEGCGCMHPVPYYIDMMYRYVHITYILCLGNDLYGHRHPSYINIMSDLGVQQALYGCIRRDM